MPRCNGITKKGQRCKRICKEAMMCQQHRGVPFDNMHGNPKLPRLSSLVSERLGTARILLGCHPQKLGNHWYGDYIRRVVRSVGYRDVHVTTADLLSGGDVRMDLFSHVLSSDVRRYHQKYDVVVAPDCDGLWWEMRDSVDGMRRLIYRLSRYARRGGWVVVSKITRKTVTGLMSDHPNFADSVHAFYEPHYKVDWMLFHKR